jgi:hypothetical protein
LFTWACRWRRTEDVGTGASPTAERKTWEEYAHSRCRKYARLEVATGSPSTVIRQVH